MLCSGKHQIEEQLFDEGDAGDEQPAESVRAVDDAADVQDFDSEEESGKDEVALDNED